MNSEDASVNPAQVRRLDLNVSARDKRGSRRVRCFCRKHSPTPTTKKRTRRTTKTKTTCTCPTQGPHPRTHIRARAPPLTGSCLRRLHTAQTVTHATRACTVYCARVTSACMYVCMSVCTFPLETFAVRFFFGRGLLACAVTVFDASRIIFKQLG